MSASAPALKRYTTIRGVSGSIMKKFPNSNDPPAIAMMMETIRAQRSGVSGREMRQMRPTPTMQTRSGHRVEVWAKSHPIRGSIIIVTAMMKTIAIDPGSERASTFVRKSPC